MASFVNRRTANEERIVLLPSRYNRTAVDRFAYGCRQLSKHGVSVSLHQTLIQGSASGLFSAARRLWEGNSHARETPASPHAGPSKRWAHATGRSQLGFGAAGGQPRGERS